MQAGNFRAGEQLREAALGRGSFEGHAIEQELRAAGAQQQAALAALGKRGVQLLADDVELRHTARVFHSIQAGKFEQHIEAADKGTGGRRFGVCGHRWEPFLRGLASPRKASAESLD
jgi:hypothetical protein